MNINNYKSKYTIMKRTFSVITLFSILLTACVGDPGPPGFDGQDALSAESFDTIVDFEYFDDSGLHETSINLPFDLNDSEAVLVYRLEDIVNIDGLQTNAWSLLPQNFFLDDGNIIQYIFNHTFTDVELLIDGNFDLSTLDPVFTQNQRFRVVILPAVAISSIDVSNINNVIETFKITEFKIF